MATYDDGSGSALYAGGKFTSAGEVIANRIARWDGNTWSPLSGPAGNGMSASVVALAVYDDGSGPALYAGGYLTTAGGLAVNSIARWDGGGWSALSGPSGTGTNGAVNALAVYDDGSGPALYVGGDFTTAGGVLVNSIAKWNGSGWSALSGPGGTGVSSSVSALAVYDDGTGPALYAGGFFATAGGVLANHIAKWDGSAWSALTGPSETGANGRVYALATYDDGTGPALYAGGFFTTAGGVTVNRVAKWDGTAWSPLSGPSGTGLDALVRALAVYDDGTGPALYAGGFFITAGGVLVNRVAKWDGDEWSALSGPAGTGTSDYVYALATYDDGGGLSLYVGGWFTGAGNQVANHIARWDGGAWSELNDSDGAGVDGSIGLVLAMAVYDDGNGSTLYVGGLFTRAGGTVVNRIARWDGESWMPLGGPAGTGMNELVAALTVFDDGGGPALYAGGFFTTAGGVTVNHVARWDGSAWSALAGPGDTGTDGDVYSLVVHDDGSGPALYVGGDFITAGGVMANGVAKWDGASWSALSGPSDTGTDGIVRALAAYDDGGGPALYAGGTFTTAGGVTVNRIAKWNGLAWSPLDETGGSGMDDAVYAFEVYDDGGGAGLYAGGAFVTAGGVVANYVAKWNGSGWSALSGPAGTGMDSFGRVRALGEYDDGGGPALFAGGDFTTAGGVVVNRVAKWDGSSWSALTGPAGTGMGPEIVQQFFGSNVNELAVYDDGSGPALYAVGSFSMAGGLPSRNIARWLCTDRIFADGFESGNLSAWSSATGGP